MKSKQLCFIAFESHLPPPFQKGFPFTIHTGRQERKSEFEGWNKIFFLKQAKRRNRLPRSLNLQSGSRQSITWCSRYSYRILVGIEVNYANHYMIITSENGRKKRIYAVHFSKIVPDIIIE